MSLFHTDQLLSSTIKSFITSAIRMRSIGDAHAAVANQSLIERNGLHQLVKNGFKEKLNAKPLRTVTNMQNGVLQVVDFIEAKPGQNRQMATYP
jgi:hypothetical protein